MFASNFNVGGQEELSTQKIAELHFENFGKTRKHTKYTQLQCDNIS